jgi:hypothetical protein
MSGVESFVIGDLRIEAKLVDEPGDLRSLCLSWHGKSNARQADQLLLPYLGRALDRAVADGRLLELHFETLSHFNSSTIASLIQLIQSAQARTARMVVVFDPRRQWQRLSFDALQVFVGQDGCFELRTSIDGENAG